MGTSLLTEKRVSLLGPETAGRPGRSVGGKSCVPLGRPEPCPAAWGGPPPPDCLWGLGHGRLSCLPLQLPPPTPVRHQAEL